MRKFKHVIIAIIVCCMCVTLIPVQTFAKEYLNDENDPGAGRLSGYDIPKEFFGERNLSRAWSESSYTHDSRFDETYVIRKGIDVSKWQGDIDWEAVKADGIKYAIIRVAARTSIDGELLEDSYYKENIEGALAAGIPVGVYVFSQAITKSEAIEEAKYVLERIKSYDIELPVVMDCEFASGPSGRLYEANLTKTQATNICLAFCKYIEDAGYDAMIYGNRYYLRDQLYADRISETYKIWLAQYNSKTTYDGHYDFWQCSSSGTVDGIKGKVDMDFWYIPETELDQVVLNVSGTSTGSVNLKWTRDEEAIGYELYRKKDNNEFTLINTFEGNDIVSYNDEGLSSGTIYSYKVRPVYQNEDGTIVYGEFSNAKKGITVVAKASLSKKEASFDAIKLSWKKVTGANGYQLQKYNSSTGKYTTLKTITSGSTLQYTNENLNANTTYKYRIRAYKTVNGKKVYGKYSDAFKAKTNGSVKGKVNTSTVKVRSGAGTSYKKLATVKKNKILKITGSKGSWYRISISINGKTKTAYIGKKYVDLTTTTIRRPAKPVLNVKATSFYKIKLTWEKTSGASGYEIQRYNKSKDKYETIKTITSGSTLSYVNGSLNAATTYKYRIRAYKILGSEKRYGYYSSAKSTKTLSAQKAKINASNVNIRKGPGTSYAVLKTLGRNTTVRLTGSRGSWYRTSVTVSGKKKTGYVLNKYVTW